MGFEGFETSLEISQRLERSPRGSHGNIGLQPSQQKVLTAECAAGIATNQRLSVARPIGRWIFPMCCVAQNGGFLDSPRFKPSSCEVLVTSLIKGRRYCFVENLQRDVNVFVAENQRR